MNNNKITVLAILVVSMFLVISSSIYIVTEQERAILLQFKRVIKMDVAPGLHFKLPFIQEVRKFDARVQLLDAQQQTFLTKEKKFLNVDSYMTWRIHDVERYFTSTNGDELRAASLLAPRMEKGLREQFGERTMHEIVTAQREQLMEELTQDLNNIAINGLGIEVLDIRVKRIDLPANVSESVFQRMRTEREQLANEYRSTGKKQKIGIEAEANRQRQVILAEAKRDAEKTRGEGDALATSTYAKAYNQDPDFYAFYRSLQAYKQSFADKDDLLVVEPDSEFFKFLRGKN